MVKEINVVVEVHNMRYRVLSLYKKSLSDEQRLRKLAIAMKWKMEFRQVPPLFAISRPLPIKILQRRHSSTLLEFKVQ